VGAPNTNPLSYNAFVQQIGVLAVEATEEVSGVYQFASAPLQEALPQLLNYAELRIQRDLDLLNSQTSNIYTCVAGNPIISIPVDDFLTIQTLEVVTQTQGSSPLTTDTTIYTTDTTAITTDATTTGGGSPTVVNATPLLPVSKEFIQNCFAGLSSANTPMYFSMYGDNFGNGADTNLNVLLGPTPNYAYSLRVTGTIRIPSLYKYASAGPADTTYTYISAYYPDLLIMAAMIYVSAYQRNFSSTSDSPDMGQSYEKQYQMLRIGAIQEENRRKFQGSGWSSYSTPVSATPTR